MIRIVTDSACDLPNDLIEQHRIAVVPLTIRFGEKEYLDREGLSTDDFWHMLTTGDVLPETAAPSIGRFHEIYTRLSSEGADGIVVICISSALSATIQAAQAAAQQFTSGVPVRVIDSRLVSTALGFVAVEAAETSAAGASLREVVATAEAAAGSSNIVAALDTLEYLKRGGRIGGAAAFLGEVLSVKPLITVRDGAVGPAGRVRTRTKALAALIDHVAGLGERIRRLAIVHSTAPDIDEFVDSLSEVYQGDHIVCLLGPVVGTHTGPGVVAVAYRLD
jgi:DegV family protein with EDD domain